MLIMSHVSSVRMHGCTMISISVDRMHTGKNYRTAFEFPERPYNKASFTTLNFPLKADSATSHSHACNL